ncbi:MAG TPA: hypothetical protein VKF80_10930 [Candidatus Eisenbacteria bacterium]|nr:hypothetical protein [Candidatus Eisenbacteria bacterium]
MTGLLFCFVLSITSASGTPVTKLDLPATIAFDERTHHLFMYGHEIHSPVTLAYDKGDLVANGFRPNPIVEDTARAESVAARVYNDVPFIQGLHAQGKSYRAAGREYETAWTKTVYRAMGEFRSAWIAGDSANAEQRAKAVLDTSLIDVERTLIGDLGSAVVLKGLGDSPIYCSAPDRTPTPPPMTPEEQEADRRTGAMDQAWEIQSFLVTADQGLMVLGGPKGGVGIVQRGVGAYDALDEIKRSIKYGVPDGSVVPEALLREIIAAQAHH